MARNLIEESAEEATRFVRENRQPLMSAARAVSDPIGTVGRAGGKAVKEGVKSVYRGVKSGLRDPEPTNPVTPATAVGTPPAVPAAAMAPGQVGPMDGSGRPVFQSQVKPSRVAAPVVKPTVAAPVVASDSSSATAAVMAEDRSDGAPTPAQTTTAAPAAVVPSAVPIQGMSQEMTSPAARRMREQFAVSSALTGIRARAGGAREARLMGSIAGKQLESRWQDAERAAFMAALSPAQRAKIEKDEQLQAMQSAQLYRQTPEFIESEGNRNRDVQVAKEQGQAEALKAAIPAGAHITVEQLRSAAENAKTQAEKDHYTALIAAQSKEGEANRASEEKRTRMTVEGREKSVIDYANEAKQKFMSDPNTALLTPEQVQAHLALIDQHISGVKPTVTTVQPQYNAQPQTKVYTASEAQALPVGTIYVGSDGIKRRR